VLRKFIAGDEMSGCRSNESLVANTLHYSSKAMGRVDFDRESINRNTKDEQ